MAVTWLLARDGSTPLTLDRFTLVNESWILDHVLSSRSQILDSTLLYFQGIQSPFPTE
jgi:hypothetical protein